MENLYLNNQSFSFTHKAEPLPFSIDKRLVDQWVAKYHLSTGESKDFSLELDGKRYRVHLFHSMLGWNAALRLLPDSILSFKQLNINEKEVMSVCVGTGLTLFCGPTSSGKSTTMCTVTDALLRSGELGVTVTIEDPIEYVYNNQIIFQREVGADVDSFPSGLVDAVRATPKTIIIGEIRDTETALEAIKAGLNGHRVFATLHAVNIKQAISRILAFVGNDAAGLLVQALQGIFVQKIIRAKNKRYCVYESLCVDEKVRNVLTSVFHKNSTASLNLLNHNQYEQKRGSINDKEQLLMEQGFISRPSV